MTEETKKLERMKYLDAMLWKYLNTEPKLTMNELAVVIAEQVFDKDLVDFIKKYKKEIK